MDRSVSVRALGADVAEKVFNAHDTNALGKELRDKRRADIAQTCQVCEVWVVWYSSKNVDAPKDLVLAALLNVARANVSTCSTRIQRPTDNDVSFVGCFEGSNMHHTRYHDAHACERNASFGTNDLGTTMSASEDLVFDNQKVRSSEAVVVVLAGPRVVPQQLHKVSWAQVNDSSSQKEGKLRASAIALAHLATPDENILLERPKTFNRRHLGHLSQKFWRASFRLPVDNKIWALLKGLAETHRGVVGKHGKATVHQPRETSFDQVCIRL